MINNIIKKNYILFNNKNIYIENKENKKLYENISNKIFF